MANTDKAFLKVKPGAPIKLDQAKIEKICNFIRIGAYPEIAAASQGIHKDRLSEWLKIGAKTEKPEGVSRKLWKLCCALNREVTQAVGEAALRDLASIDRAANGVKPQYERDPITKRLVLDADGNPILLTPAVKQDWKAAAWRLERRFRGQYSPHETVEHMGDTGPQVVFMLPPNGSEAQAPVMTASDVLSSGMIPEGQ